MSLINAETKVALDNGQRVQRKYLITVAEWGGTWDDSGDKPTYTGTTNREILGTRVEDSSIEFNADIATSTDIRGTTYTDVNKTEPQQTFDPMYVLGGSDLGEYLVKAALKNDIDKYNGVFNIYIITAFIGVANETSVSETEPKETVTDYYAVLHRNCSVIPTSLGGDAYTAMPIEVHYSNDLFEGSVNKLAKAFTFKSAELGGDITLT